MDLSAEGSRTITLPEVLDEYRFQGVTLDDELNYHLTREDLHPPTFCHCPNDLLIAIAQAGKTLREHPELPLATGELVVPPAISDDFLANIFTSIVNASVNPVQGPSLDRTFNCTKLEGRLTCSYADEGFGLTLVSIARLMKDKRYEHFPGFRVVPDQNNVPVFLQKSDGTKSSLALQDIVINGIPYPAGSLIRTDHIRDYDQANNRFDYPEIRRDVISFLPINGIAKASFLRLSAFAFKPSQRVQLFGSARTRNLEKEDVTIWDSSIEEIKEILAAFTEKFGEHSERKPKWHNRVLSRGGSIFN